MTARVPRLREPLSLADLHRDFGLSKDEAFQLVTTRAVLGQLERGRLVIERASLEAWERSSREEAPPRTEPGGG